mgnify:CR=1 FL=1
MLSNMFFITHLYMIPHEKYIVMATPGDHFMLQAVIMSKQNMPNVYVLVI